MTREEALTALDQAGFRCRTCDKGPKLILGCRKDDYDDTGVIGVFRRAFHISLEPNGSFTVRHMLDRMDFESNVSSLGAAVEVVLQEYRKAGLLP
jgi:hypothetical protein